MKDRRRKEKTIYKNEQKGMKKRKRENVKKHFENYWKDIENKITGTGVGKYERIFLEYSNS